MLHSQRGFHPKSETRSAHAVCSLKVSQQMEVALSYNCEELASIVDAVRKLAEREGQLEHVVLVETSENTGSF